MPLTKDNITTRLQVAQYRFVLQGLEVIESQRRGKGSCNSKLGQIMQGFNLIDSIVGYDPSLSNNCLTTIQVQHILDRICLLSPLPCTAPTFSNSTGSGSASDGTGNAIQNLQNQINAINQNIAGGIEIDR